jgi:hypothetical protein
MWEAPPESRLGGLVAPDRFLVAVLLGPVPAQVRAVVVGPPRQ